MPALAQTASGLASDLAYLMKSPERVTRYYDKVLWFSGDQAAVEIRKLYDDDFLAQPRNLRNVLWILETAFAQRDWIMNADDRDPRAATSLLRSLQKNVTDERYKTSIDKLIEKLNATATIESDFGCIDPLTLPPIPINSRKQVPDLALRNSNDKPFRLSDYKGRPIVLNVWDNNSQPQVAGLTYGLQKKYQETGLAVVGMWADASGASALDAYLRKAGIANPDYPIVLGREDSARALGPGPIPLIVLIDRTGKIAAFQSSDGTGAGPYYCTYQSAIKTLLAEPVNGQ